MKRLRVLLGVILLFGCVMFLNTRNAYAITNQQGADWALAHVGAKDGDGQCKTFVNSFIKANFGIFIKGNPSELISIPLPAGWGRIRNTPDFIPEPGDIALWGAVANNAAGHIAIVVSGNINTFDSVEQNWPIGSGVHRQNHNYVSSAFWGVIRPPYNNAPADTEKPSISNIQVTNVDKDGYTVSCTVSDNSGISSVKFPSWNSDIHNGGNANWLDGTVSGNTATCRVNIWDLASGALEGNYMTHIYAYDSAGNSSVVSINGLYIDRTAPTISDISVIEKDSLGYIIQCKATDNHHVNRVQFPTWTLNADQDDIFPDWGDNSNASGFLENGYYRYRVNISDHKGEVNEYRTHIYVYDDCGNKAVGGLDSIIVTNGYQPVNLTVYNNHIYSVFNEALPWASLNELAGTMKSNLASITSAEENRVVSEIVKNCGKSQYMLGGKRDNDSVPWTWTTGELFNYADWAPGQPDFYAQKEFYLDILSDSGKWNDIFENWFGSGFVMETDLGMLPDLVTYSDNKKYEIYDVSLPWNVAKLLCEKKNGYLASVNSKVENDFLTTAIQKGTKADGYFLGANDANTEGVFAWANGDTFSYSNWSTGEPNDYHIVGGQDYARLQKDGKWDDMMPYASQMGFIAEYDLKEISVVLPTKVKYKRGDIFDATGLSVSMVFTDGSQKSVTGFTISGFDSSTLGSKKVFVEYQGKKTSFQVDVVQSLSGITMLDIPDQTYCGKAITPNVQVKLNDKNLVSGVDYTIEYANNINAGDGVVKIIGKGNYMGEVTKEFKILSLEIEDEGIVLSQNKYEYDGLNKEPTVLVPGLQVNKDFTVEYIQNSLVGTGKVILHGIGNYKGTISKYFEIYSLKIEENPIELSVKKWYYTGKEIEPIVKIGNLISGVDYQVEYENNLNIGEGTIYISGIGKYTGTTIKKFQIMPKSIANVNLTLSGRTYIYDGKEKCPLVVSSQLSNNKDYLATYQNNSEVGTAVAVITGINNYTGTKKITFQIKLNLPVVQVVAGASRASISWASVVGSAGYELQMATVRNGDYSTIKSVNGAILKYTKLNLKKGKNYYFRVRAFRVTEGKKVYSEYSVIKSVKAR